MAKVEMGFKLLNERLEYHVFQQKQRWNQDPAAIASPSMRSYSEEPEPAKRQRTE